MASLIKNKVLTFDLFFIFTLFIIKLILFNNLIDSQVSIKISLSIGIIYMIFLIGISSIFSSKFKNIIFLSTYSIISIVMIVDAVYFSQFSKLPSLIVISQITQLNAVSSSVKYLLNFKNLLLILDIMPLCIYFLFIRKKIYTKYNGMKINRNIHHTNKRILQISLVLIFVLTSVYTSAKSDGTALSQEFFSYHIRDVYNLISGNKVDIDLDPTIFNSDKDIADSEKKLFGVAKDMNVITIQVEALQNFVINDFYAGQEITPNINRLIKDNSVYYDNYYQQLGMGNTSDAEFVSHNSIYPAMNGPSYSKYEKNTFYGLPWVLKDNGYTTVALHGYEGSFWNRENAYPNQGFDKFISQKDYELKESIGLGISDKEFFNQSIEYIKSLKSPYYAFLVTLTSHHPYDMPNEYHKLKLNKEDENTLLGNYIQSIHYVDEQLGSFIENLKAEGIYENTIINIYGDHFAIPSSNDENKKMMSKYLGYDYDYDEMMRIPLITHIPNSNISEINHVAGGQIDFFPTVLNLLGLKNNKGLMFGRDLNNSTEGFVAQQTHALKGSFIDNTNMFIMSRDGIFENSRAFNMSTRESADLENFRDKYELAIKSINMSDYILEHDLLKKYIDGDKSLSVDKKSTSKKLKPEKYISHAGGRVRGLSYTNSKEALDKSYENGYKFVELDMEWTTDENLALIHDWDGYVETAFGVEQKQYSTEEFKSFTMIEGLTQMTIDDLALWLKKHDDIYIVTDVKTNNVEALELISNRYPDLVSRFIPQIYSFEEYVGTVKSGYKNIILTLYMSNYTDEQILDFSSRNKLLAVTMPIDRSKTDLPKKLNEKNIFVYSHTINKKELQRELEPYSVNGFYTDDILPD